MRGVLVAGLVLALVLSGCATKDKDPDGPDADGTASATATASKAAGKATSSGSGTATGAPSSGPNQAPVGSMGVSGNGSAPLSVNITLAGSDPDGDALNWTLGFGDASPGVNGTALPTSLAHNYTAAGTYVITYNLTDGKNTTTYRANVTVDPAAPSGTPVTFTGTVVGVDPNAAVSGFCVVDLFAGEGTAGNAGNWWAIDDAWIGWVYTIEPASLLVTYFDGAGFPSGKGGNVPPNASEVVVCADEPTAPVDFTLTLTPA